MEALDLTDITWYQSSNAKIIIPNGTTYNIVLKYKDGDNDYTITIQFEDTKDYVNCALSIITCIRSEQVYITGECNVY